MTTTHSVPWGFGIQPKAVGVCWQLLLYGWSVQAGRGSAALWTEKQGTRVWSN